MNLRPFQKESLEALKAPEAHVICIAPTGAGKSLIYEQYCRDHITKTLIISPLVALARQQMAGFDPKTVTLGIGGTKDGPPEPNCNQSSVWIVSPEKILGSYSHRAREQLIQWKPEFLVVDECHLLWEWGEKFRPAFQLIPTLIKTFQIKKSLWLSATLPQAAIDLISECLPTSIKIIGQNAIPPQIKIDIIETPLRERPKILFHYLKQLPGPGIIFVATRKQCEKLSNLTKFFNVESEYYHAGRSREEKENIEKKIKTTPPLITIATSAFGLGMNFTLLNWVIVWQVPYSVLSLTQMIGRIGRNQAQGRAILFWSPDDFTLNQWMVRDSNKNKHEMINLYQFYHSNDSVEARFNRYLASNSKNLHSSD